MCLEADVATTKAVGRVAALPVGDGHISSLTAIVCHTYLVAERQALRRLQPVHQNAGCMCMVTQRGAVAMASTISTNMMSFSMICLLVYYATVHAEYGSGKCDELASADAPRVEGTDGSESDCYGKAEAPVPI